MSTRSAIIVKVSDNEYKGVYCHFDGYPAGVGATLEKNFNSEAQALEIVALGDCSSVCGAVRINPIGEHSYAKPEEGTIVAYHRDRGEEFNQFVGKTWKAVADQIDQEYAYVWENGAWSCKE